MTHVGSQARAADLPVKSFEYLKNHEGASNRKRRENARAAVEETKKLFYGAQPYAAVSLSEPLHTYIKRTNTAIRASIKLAVDPLKVTVRAFVVDLTVKYFIHVIYVIFLLITHVVQVSQQTCTVKPAMYKTSKMCSPSYFELLRCYYVRSM